MSSSFSARIRFQSVCDFVDEERRFALGRFAERDDADFMRGFRVNDGCRTSTEEANRYEASFCISKAVVLKANRDSTED